MWNIFRTCGRDDQQGKVAGAYILAHFKGKKIAFVNDKTTYGKGLADETLKTIKAGGMKEVLYEGINTGEKDYSAIVSKIKESGADYLMWGGLHTEGGLILRQMRDQGVKAVMMGGDGIASQEFAAIAGPGVEGNGVQPVSEQLDLPKLVQDAQHGILAVDGRHDGNAEVDEAICVFDAKTTVLGNTALGDVEFAHHLNASDDRGMMFLGHGLHSRLQYSINAVLNYYRIMFRLDMNIASPFLQCCKDRSIHQANDGTDFTFSGNAVDGKVLIGCRFFLLHHIQNKTFARLLQHPLGLFGLFENVIDLVK
jgi:predicted phosphodiesterase